MISDKGIGSFDYGSQEVPGSVVSRLETGEALIRKHMALIRLC